MIGRKLLWFPKKRQSSQTCRPKNKKIWKHKNIQRFSQFPFSYINFITVVFSNGQVGVAEDDVLMKKVEERVIIPTIQGLKKDNIVYKGFIYIGFMNVNGEPYVIEYNCRMGDPETEIVLPRIKNDLVELLVAVGGGSLQEMQIEIDERACATVIVASGGYPEDYEKGKEISGLNDVGDSIVFHAGTKAEGDKILSNGGRVLAVSSYGKDIHEAVAKSNAAIEKINFEGKYYRKDIGYEFR